jgi:hypothetical protein
MTTRNLVPTLLTVLFFGACSKPVDDNNKHPLLVDELVLYTSDGAHHDQQMIKDFITRNFHESVDNFYYGSSTVTDHIISSSLSLIDNNKATLNGTTMEIVSKTDKEMLLSPMDSTTMPAQSNSHCTLLYQQVPQHNPYSICSNAGGNCKKYREAYPIIISDGDYYLPILNYAIVVSGCKTYKYTSTPMPKYLNKDLTSGLLQYKDTVVVQTARIQVGK